MMNQHLFLWAFIRQKTKKTRPCEPRLRCFHNGIILIVNRFKKIVRQNYNKYLKRQPNFQKLIVSLQKKYGELIGRENGFVKFTATNNCKKRLK